MRFPNLENLKKRNYPNIWITLEKIQHALGWSTPELADHLGLTDKQYHYLYARNSELKIHSVARLIEVIGLSVETIVTGSIDYHALREHTSGNLFYLPERYEIGAFSKRRTSINLLEYLEERLGWKMKKNILNHFQMTEAIFSDPESQINFLFPSDLCAYLARSGYSASIFPMMGSYSIVTNKSTALGQLMKSFGAPKSLYENVFADVVGRSFDRNCNYRLLQLSDEGALMEARFTEELQESLKDKKPGNHHACAVRGGTLNSLTGYLDLPFSHVMEEACVHRGDSSCRYRVSYHQATQMQLLSRSARSFSSTFH